LDSPEDHLIMAQQLFKNMFDEARDLRNEQKLAVIISKRAYDNSTSLNAEFLDKTKPLIASEMRSLSFRLLTSEDKAALSNFINYN
jgi:hypothetical protein